MPSTIVGDWLERAGGDFVAKVFAAKPRPGLHHQYEVAVVYLGTDEVVSAEEKDSLESSKELVILLQKLKQSQAAAILFDREVVTNIPEARRDQVLDQLRQWNADVPIIMLERASGMAATVAASGRNFATERSWVDGSRPNRPRRVISVLKADSDGVVRSMFPDVCGLPPDMGWQRYPTLAFAFSRGQHDDVGTCPEKGDDKEQTPAQHILYRQTGRLVSADSGSIKLIPSQAIDGSMMDLAGKFILIGQISAADLHMTPLGQLPGIIVQANALATALNYPEGVTRKTPLLVEDLLEILLLAALMAVVPVLKALMLQASMFAWTGLRRHHWSWRMAAIMRDECFGESRHFRGERGDFERVAGREWWFKVFGLVVNLAALGSILSFYWFWWLKPFFYNFAEDALQQGVVVGTFLPLLSVTLEALLDLGEEVRGVALISVRWVTTNIAAITIRGARPGIVLAIGLAAISATAARAGEPDDCSIGMTLEHRTHVAAPEGGSTQNPWEGVFVYQGKPPARTPNWMETIHPLHPYDTIQIRQEEASVTVHQSGMDKTITGPDARYVVPPCTSKSDALATQNFFGTILAANTEVLTRVGQTNLTRGDLAHIGRVAAAIDAANVMFQISQLAPGGDINVPLRGQLRPLPVLAAQNQKLAKDREGLAYAWSGGQAPFTATIAGGEATAVVETANPFIWLANWRLRADIGSIVIKDGSGAELRVGLAAANEPATSPASLGEVMGSFSGGHEVGRLEALRELQERAASDVVAAQAVAAIRLSGLP